MILRGILERSLGGFVCIRGHAPLGDLERVSSADASYQRDLIKTHRQQIEEFLDDQKFLFFPEVVLGYTLDLPAAGGGGGHGEPLAALLDGKAYRGGNAHAGLNIKVKRMSFTGTTDVRVREHVLLATVEIPDRLLADGKTLLHRIDDNHRLSAARTNAKYSLLRTPFCLVLFQPGDESKRQHKVIFHNINSRSIPLTPEENLAVILDDEQLFPDRLLTEKAYFGWEYLLARRILKKLSPDYLDHIRVPLEKKRTALVATCRLLLDRKAIEAKPGAADKVLAALKRVNQLYATDETLQANDNPDLLAAFTYFALKDKEHRRLNPFAGWIRGNLLARIKRPAANKPTLELADSLITIFEQVMESRRKTIFVSMQFCPETKETYLTIEKAVQQINEKHKLTVRLKPVRIDQFNKGHSYTITDEILELIEGSGLLIADLTFGNKNVYHEVGFLMGLNRGRSLPHANFILIADKRRGDEIKKDIGFNLADWQQLRFESERHLEVELTKMLEKHYGLAS